jgi:peptidoglycan L-alanyl-D-glutamate endopeptidase CwlK
MPKRFGTVPPEVPVNSSLDGLAPKVRGAALRIVARMQEQGFAVRIFETLRTAERQSFLYGFGRDYDDGRGKVTKVASADDGWHFYGLAVDFVEDDKDPWTASQAFWRALGEAAEDEGMTWGGRWKFLDVPHTQFGKCKVSPSDHARKLYAAGGKEAVWRACGAL